jgi:hypothetical protein
MTYGFTYFDPKTAEWTDFGGYETPEARDAAMLAMLQAEDMTRQ